MDKAKQKIRSDLRNWTSFKHLPLSRHDASRILSLKCVILSEVLQIITWISTVNLIRGENQIEDTFAGGTKGTVRVKENVLPLEKLIKITTLF